MTHEMKRELENAIHSDMSLFDIVALLRRFRDQGLTREDAYLFLEALALQTPDEAEQDRIDEIADFVSGYCSPHMKVWDDANPIKSAN
jgi:hypothetical protein